MLTVGYVGRLVPEKGVADLLRAAAAVPQPVRLAGSSALGRKQHACRRSPMNWDCTTAAISWGR